MNRSMIHLRLIPIMLLLAGMSLSGRAWGDTGVSENMTTEATCVVKIAGGNGATAISPEVVNTLLNSVGVKGRAFREVLGRVPREDDGVVDISFNFLTDSSSAGPFEGADTILSELRVDYLADPDTYQRGADELLRALVERLKAVMEDAGKTEFQMMEERAKIAKVERLRVEEQLKKLQALQQALIEEAGRTDLERDSILNEQHELEQQIAGTELELAGFAVRRQAIEQQIARISEMIKKPGASDPMLEALQKIVEVRDEQYAKAQVQFKAQVLSTSDLANAETDLASARAELWRYQKELAERSAGGSLEELNSELNHLTIAETETQAKLHLLKQKLEEMKARKLLELADRYEREVRIQREVAEDAFENALRREDEIERMRSSWRPPTVTVIGAQ